MASLLRLSPRPAARACLVLAAALQLDHETLVAEASGAAVVGAELALCGDVLTGEPDVEADHQVLLLGEDPGPSHRSLP